MNADLNSTEANEGNEAVAVRKDFQFAGEVESTRAALVVRDALVTDIGEKIFDAGARRIACPSSAVALLRRVDAARTLPFVLTPETSSQCRGDALCKK